MYVYIYIYIYRTGIDIDNAPFQPERSRMRSGNHFANKYSYELKTKIAATTESKILLFPITIHAI